MFLLLLRRSHCSSVLEDLFWGDNNQLKDTIRDKTSGFKAEVPEELSHLHSTVMFTEQLKSLRSLLAMISYWPESNLVRRIEELTDDALCLQEMFGRGLPTTESKFKGYESNEVPVNGDQLSQNGIFGASGKEEHRKIRRTYLFCILGEFLASLHMWRH